jgi:hypothetical protein
MASTSAFGWETPDDTDLVKDGAAAIRTLGNSIDTSMSELKGGTTGQVLSKTSNTDMDFTWVTSDDANAIQNAIVDAKGDLIAATANDTPARLAVGTNGQVLTADSTAATGLTWATPAAGGMTSIATGTMSGGAVLLNSIPSGYVNLVLQVTGWYNSTDTKMAIRFNNDTSANYVSDTGAIVTNGSFPSSYFNATDTQDNSSGKSTLEITIPAYTNTTSWKIANCFSMTNNGTTPANFNWLKTTGFYNTTSAITQIQLLPESGGSFSAGTYTLYGVK